MEHELRPSWRLGFAAATGFILAVSSALAAPPVRGPARRPGGVETVRTRTTAAVPAEPVALQLSGLRINVPAPRVAVVHALGRDAWPGLVRCVGPNSRLRGYATVEISEVDGALSVRVSGGPAARDRGLAECVRHAVERIELPPYEGDTPGISVSFELAFGMPAAALSQRRE